METGLECACVNNPDFTVLVSGGGRRPWVSMCTVLPSHSKWLSKWSNESAPNFALSLNIPLQNLCRWLKRLQLKATGDWQLHQDKAPTHASHLGQSFWWNIKSPRWLSPPQPRFGALWLLAFPKTKITFEFHTVDENQKSMMSQLMAIGRTAWGPKVSTSKRTEVSLSYV